MHKDSDARGRDGAFQGEPAGRPVGTPDGTSVGVPGENSVDTPHATPAGTPDGELTARPYGRRTKGRRFMRPLLRIGLWTLCAVEVILGVWTQFFPLSFYTTVPTVNLTPPYSEHLMRDFGGATLGVAVVLGVAAWTLDRLLVTCALSAYLVFAVPHFVFHIAHLDHFSTAEAVGLTAVLVASLVMAGGLLTAHVVETRRDSHDLRHTPLG